MKLLKKCKTKVLSLCLLFTSTLSISNSAIAEMQWGDLSLSYLYGNQYEVGDKSRHFVTVEHASGHTWGDNFFFYDRSKSKDGTLESYAELSPRLSLGYVSGRDLSFGIVSDIFVAATWEEGASFNNYLLGLGVNLKLPGFNYFTANVYQANNSAWDNDQLLTLTWAYPFNIGSSDFLYDGFLDWSNSSDSQAAEMNFTSQLKYNISNVFGAKSPIYIGLEYAFWNNKFGISGVDERNASLLLKWHF